MADELHDLLQAAGVPAPYVLAGHSSGGYIARVFAARHPELVAGVVLVDSSHPDQDIRLQDRPRFGAWQVARRLAWPQGLTRLAVDLGLRPDNRDNAERSAPPDLVVAYAAMMRTSAERRAGIQERLGMPPGAAAVRAESKSLGSMPLLVLTAASCGRG
jgi:pimeloyl-ACP methyl ester carboxylesterase